METLTKKRLQAFLIDTAISTAAALTAEYFLRKKVKNEAFHTIVTPTLMMWGLEYIQLRRSGQTIGYKKTGLKLEHADGLPLTSAVIAKRIGYRDTISTIDYIKSKESFEADGGAIFPHDRYAGTVVRRK
ncbi:RDD family protein [Halobacillus sp. ACCC02827]|uniref:RDD family protein n=1 Tax=Bacillaceae TaxID=186817 RepID=UPI0002A4D70D|nr:MULTISPECIES: RDD family protein [Bacillaceae]ELK45927.1 hypothetical protein D479_12928 [Halobacillus sp. BAB-2008]QHT45270.1 RDD family protein [Bacillus sp. SB49]WJE16050.1 RDD family protein [Halobacillus sp. ACCC02827]